MALSIIAGIIVALTVIVCTRALVVTLNHAVQARASLQTGAEAESNRRHDETLASTSNLIESLATITAAAALRDDRTEAALDEFRNRLFRSECEQYDLAVRAQAAAPIRLRMP